MLRMKSKQSGVSLLEVLIALLIIAFGTLGLAKLQALTISDTANSGFRSLISYQAASLAATMHSNKTFWQVAAPAAPQCNGAGACNFSGKTTTAFGADPGLSGCSYASPCQNTQIAALDMDRWMTNMYALVPSYGLNINCTVAASLPTTCVINITWSEKQVGMNATTASAATSQGLKNYSYFLYVQP